MEDFMKINYAPNTIFIVGEMGDAELKIVNSKGTLVNKYGKAKEVIPHCQKCKERILAILN